MLPVRWSMTCLLVPANRRYGTVPIAHSTGGLRDTIDDFNTFAPEGGCHKHA
jgi:starch synthase